MRIFCCNSADGCHGIFACGWCTVELLKHNEQSICDTHIENKTLRQKRNNFPFVNIPYICSNIPTAPAYDVYISQVIDIPELVVSIMISLIAGCC